MNYRLFKNLKRLGWPLRSMRMKQTKVCAFILYYREMEDISLLFSFSQTSFSEKNMLSLFSSKKRRESKTLKYELTHTFMRTEKHTHTHAHKVKSARDSFIAATIISKNSIYLICICRCRERCKEEREREREKKCIVRHIFNVF